MATRKPVDQAMLSKALGSSRVVPVAASASRGPLELLHLQAEVERRLRPAGGRPTDPNWTLSRVVRFNPERWQALADFAATLSKEGRTVSPAQLASILVERGLVEISLTSPPATGESTQAPSVLPTPLIGDEFYFGLSSAAGCIEAEGEPP